MTCLFNKARHLLGMIVLGGGIGLATGVATTAYAGVINGCVSTQVVGVVCAFPDNPSPGTPTTILLPAVGTPVFYFWSGSTSNNTYAFNYEITNNTNQTMTDLHLGIFVNDLDPPLGPFNINFPGVGTSDVFMNASITPPKDLDFVGPNVLANGLSTTVQFSINLPANDPGVFGGRGLRVQVTPSFGVIPEPTSLASVGVGLLALAIVRCRRTQTRQFAGLKGSPIS